MAGGPFSTRSAGLELGRKAIIVSRESRKRVVGIDSRENEARWGRPGEENGRVVMKDWRGRTDGVFQAVRKYTSDLAAKPSGM